MLRRTEKKVRYIFGGVLLLLLSGIAFYSFNQPQNVSSQNKFFKDVSFYQSHAKPNEKPTVIFEINWSQLMKKSTVQNPDNFTIEQVKADGKDWLALENGKKCKLISIQYVYAPWVDTEEKRQKADPSQRDKKVTQLFVSIDPQEENGDNFRITAKNVEAETGEKMDSEESAIVEVTNFNKLIKR